MLQKISKIPESSVKIPVFRVRLQRPARYSILKCWWARRDSNPQPSGYEPPALTIELQALGAVSGAWVPGQWFPQHGFRSNANPGEPQAVSASICGRCIFRGQPLEPSRAGYTYPSHIPHEEGDRRWWLRTVPWCSSWRTSR